MQDDREQSEPSYEEYLEEIDRSTDPGLLMGFLDPELESQLPETTTSPETSTTPELDMSHDDGAEVIAMSTNVRGQRPVYLHGQVE
jgi:hypothetical protein